MLKKTLRPPSAENDARRFMERICPAIAKSGEPVLDRGPELGASLLVPLYLAAGTAGVKGAQLRLEGGALAGSDTRDRLLAARYVVMIYDTPPKAKAAEQALLMTGSVDVAESAPLATGEGVLLARIPFCAAPSATARTLTFAGTGGQVMIDVHDARVSAGQSLNPSLSLEFAHLDVSEHLFNFDDSSFDHLHRAKFIARTALEAITSDLTLHHFQREIEKIDGARISISAISVQDVLDEIENILGDLSLEVELPSAQLVRMAIRRRIEGLERNATIMVHEIATDLISSKKLRRI